MSNSSLLIKLTDRDHRRNLSNGSPLGRSSPRPSVDGEKPRASDEGVSIYPKSKLSKRISKNLTLSETVILWRENQRISLRAFLRNLLSNPQIAQTRAMQEFLTFEPVTPTDADVVDITRRKAMDEKRVEEQKQFYEIARKRAADLDMYMEQ